MPTMHELFDGSDTDLLGVFLNTIDEHTTFGDAFLAGLAAGKDCTLIAGVDADLHSPSLFMDVANELGTEIDWIETEPKERTK